MCVFMYIMCTHTQPLSCWLSLRCRVFAGLLQAAGGSGGPLARHTCCASVTEATYNYITN